MATEEMTEGEMWAVILAKLDELGKKIDDTNRKMEKMNFLLSTSMLSSSSCPSPSTASAPTSSSTSTSPGDATLIIPTATMEVLPAAPTKCSTSAPNQDARIDARVPASSSTYSASPMTSSTSSPPRDAALVDPLATMEPPPSAPAKCSALGFYQAARVSVTATTEAAPITASSTSTMPQAVFPTNKIATTKTSTAVLARCSTYGRTSDMHLTEPQITSPAATLLLSVDKSHDLNTVGHQVLQLGIGGLIDPSMLCRRAGFCGSQTHVVFEVTPHGHVCLLLDDGKFKEMYQDYLSDVGKIFSRPPDDAIHGKGYKEFKPPWVLCISWFRKMQMIIDLLEISPWFREYVVFVQLRAPWPPPDEFVHVKHHQFVLKEQPIMASHIFQDRTKDVKVLWGLLISGLLLSQITHSIGPQILAMKSEEDACGAPDPISQWIVRKPWPPPKTWEIRSVGTELQLTPWSSLSCHIVVLQLLPPQPLPEPRLLMLQSYIIGNRRYCMELYQLNSDQVWLFTKMLACKITLLNETFIPAIYLWWKDQMNFLLLYPSQEKCKVRCCGREAFGLFQPYLHTLLFDNEACEWRCGQSVTTELACYSYDQAIDVFICLEKDQGISNYSICARGFWQMLVELLLTFMPEQGNDQMDILVQGNGMETFCDLLIPDPQEEEEALQFVWDYLNQDDDDLLGLLGNQTPLRDCRDFFADMPDISCKEILDPEESREAKRRRTLEYPSESSQSEVGTHETGSPFVASAVATPISLLCTDEPLSLNCDMQYSSNNIDTINSLSNEAAYWQEDNHLEHCSYGTAPVPCTQESVAYVDNQAGISGSSEIAPATENLVMQETRKLSTLKVSKAEGSEAKVPTSHAMSKGMIKH